MIVTHLQKENFGRVVLQKDHSDLALQLARAFGNNCFRPLEPKELMELTIGVHDKGWDHIDARIPRNAKSQLPYHLIETPLEMLLETGPSSVEYSAALHPYVGLLVAMHAWGLFNGRYGMSDKVVVDLLQGEAKIKAEKMLAALFQRQQELKIICEKDPLTAPFVTHDHLMKNYKLLQFFDTLSLYFNENAGREGQATSFINVPLDIDKDTVVQLTPLSNKRYRLEPYPFGGAQSLFTMRYYEVPRLEGDVDYQVVLREVPEKRETLTLVA